MENKEKKAFALIVKEGSKHKGEMGEVFNCDDRWFGIKGLKGEPGLCFFRPDEVKLFVEASLKELKKIGITKKEMEKEVFKAIQNKTKG